MRDIRLRDGSRWQLETVLADAPKGRSSRRQVSQARTWVWVRCISGMREHRLLFAATWELWPDDRLAQALHDDLARTTPTAHPDAGAATPSAPPRTPPPTTELGRRLERGREG